MQNIYKVQYKVQQFFEVYWDITYYPQHPISTKTYCKQKILIYI